MLAQSYNQIKRISTEIGKAGRTAIANAKAEEQKHIKEWEAAAAIEAEKRVEIASLAKQIASDAKATPRAGTDAAIEIVDVRSGGESVNQVLINAPERHIAEKDAAEVALSKLEAATIAASEQVAAATAEHERIKAAVGAMDKALQEKVAPYFDLLDRAGLIPPVDSLTLRGGMGAASVGAASIVGGVAAYGTTGSMTEALTLLGGAATALGTTTALALHPGVFRHLQMAGVVTPVTFATNAVFTQLLTGSLDRESFNAGIAPFLVALWVLDVLGIPARDALLARSSLPDSAHLLLKIILSVALVLAAVTLGPGLLGGAPTLMDTVMFPALPFAAAISTKVLMDAGFARSRALAHEGTALVSIDPASLSPTERVNYQNMRSALDNLNTVVATHLRGITAESTDRIDGRLAALRAALPAPMALAAAGFGGAHVSGFGAPGAAELPGAAVAHRPAAEAHL